MQKVFLTSSGLSDRLQNLFFEQIDKKANEIKVIFVPSAGVHSDGAREGLSLCINHLSKMGILPEHIFVYHLGYLLTKGYIRTYSTEEISGYPQFRLLTPKEMSEYDVILFGGGDAGILLSEMNRTGFSKVVKQAVKSGLLYLGISAGSMVAAGNLPDSLGYIKNPIVVHSKDGTPCGKIPNEGEIHLTDRQAIWIEGESIQIVE